MAVMKVAEMRYPQEIALLGSMVTDLTLLAYAALHEGQRETAAAAYHAATRTRVAYRRIREGDDSNRDLSSLLGALDDDLVLIEASVDGSEASQETSRWIDAIKDSRTMLASQ